MKKLAGAAVFVVTLVVALLVTSYYNRPRPVVPTITLDPPAADTPPEPRPEGSHYAQLVTLDVAARKSHTTVVVQHARGARPPERLWVWTGFFVPGDRRGRVFAGEPVLVEPSFGWDGRAAVKVTAACPWFGQRDAPAAGYYAQVNVSTVSAAEARLEDEQVSREPSKATPVTVEEGRPGSR